MQGGNDTKMNSSGEGIGFQYSLESTEGGEEVRQNDLDCDAAHRDEAHRDDPCGLAR